MRRVPKLLPAYIQRDAWTKLNVAPAKIMQVSLFICFPAKNLIEQSLNGTKLQNSQKYRKHSETNTWIT